MAPLKLATPNVQLFPAKGAAISYRTSAHPRSPSSEAASAKPTTVAHPKKPSGSSFPPSNSRHGDVPHGGQPDEFRLPGLLRQPGELVRRPRSVLGPALLEQGGQPDPKPLQRQLGILEPRADVEHLVGHGERVV